MHIGLVIYGALDTLSGGYLYDRRLVDYLRRQGDQVTLFSRPWRNYGRHLTDNLDPIWRRTLASAQVDILLQDELNHPSLAWVNGWLRGRVTFPIVSIVHHLRCSEVHPRLRRSLYRRVESRYLRRVDGFVFNSQTTRQVVQGVIGKSAPWVVATPGVDHVTGALTLAQIQQRAYQPGPLRILFVGNLIPRKGLHTLLTALASLVGKPWHLTVVGNPTVDNGYTKKIHQQICRQNLTAQIALAGRVTDLELAHLLANHHVLAVPSTYEGFGIVYLEAQAHGLPVIATQAGAGPEVITHDADGFLVPPEDASALAHHLTQLIQDRRLLARLATAAYTRHQSRPGWDEGGEKIRAFLKQMRSS